MSFFISFQDEKSPKSVNSAGEEPVEDLMSVGYRPPYKRNVSRPPPSALLQVSYRYCSTTKNFNFRTHLANLHGIARPSKILAFSSFGTVFTFKVWAKKHKFKNWPLMKKSTIFVLSSWNLVKMITSWGNHFHQFSWG